MKTIIAVVLVAAVVAGILLNIHIIRLDEGFEVISKDQMTFRDTYADVRNWGLKDYMSHAPRIRNYLLYEKQYAALMKIVGNNKGTFQDEANQLMDSAKKKFNELFK
ncbi:MAG: hypothetical protein B6245_16165 [Desulfobacteraceae bacterium 4572_88]|nr:MAG: hypothetical protein B6245_16165 [Desulfobacteraceae bacterium 4572_88]